jgi:hypothetical protein
VEGVLAVSVYASNPKKSHSVRLVIREKSLPSHLRVKIPFAKSVLELQILEALCTGVIGD